MSIFSERLKSLREQSDYTQKDIAEMLGLTQSSYSKYEYGTREPNLENIEKLSEIFNVSIDFLFGKESKKMEVVDIPILVDIVDENLIYDQEEKFPLPESFILGTTFGYQVKDDTMKLMDIKKDDLVIVLLTKELKDSDIGLVIANEKLLIRKVSFLDFSIVLTPADEKSIPLLDRKENVSIIGRVIGVFKEFSE